MKSLFPLLALIAISEPDVTAQSGASAGTQEQGDRANGEEARGRRRLLLSRDECVDLAIRYNNDLSAEWLTRRIADTAIERAEGAFDPLFTTRANWADRNIPTDSALGGALILEETNIHWDSGLSGLLPTGMTYALTWNVDNVDTNNAFTLLNPRTRNTLDLEVVQPLLRGAWTTVGRFEVLSAEISKDVADENFHTTLASLIHRTINAYWELYFATQDVEVKRVTLELGEELLKITKRRYEEGLVPSSDILTVSADVKRRYQLYIQSLNLLRAAEDNLKRLIFPIASRAEWEFEVVPTDKPGGGEELLLPSMEEVLAEAFRYRPELRASRLDVRNRELVLEVAKNDLMPQLDFVGVVTSQALGSELRDTWEDTLTGENPSYTVGLSLSLPLGNRIARANVRAAELDLQRSIELLRSLENTIALEVRAAVREVYYLEEQSAAATQTRRATEEDHRARRVKLELGLITQFEFQEVEEDLRIARTEEIRAQTEHQKALNNLNLARGALLRDARLDKILRSERFRQD